MPLTPDEVGRRTADMIRIVAEGADLSLAVVARAFQDAMLTAPLPHDKLHCPCEACINDRRQRIKG